MLRLKELFAGASLDIACNTVTAILLVIIYWPLLDHYLLLAWLGISALIIAHRAFMLRNFRLAPSSLPNKNWLKKYEVSALCSGCAWGAIFSYSAITLPAQHLPAFTLILGALVAVPLATYFAQSSIYIRFSTPAMLVPIIVLMASAEPLKIVLALLTLGWYVVTNQNARQLTEQRNKLAYFRQHKHETVLADIEELVALDEATVAKIQHTSELIATLHEDSMHMNEAPGRRRGD